MSEYQVKMLIISKADRKRFEHLKLSSKKFYSIAVIDEFLKHIQEDVQKNHTEDNQGSVRLRFHLYEVVSTEKKTERVEIGTFEYEVTADKAFVDENRFYQIVETEIYLNESNVSDSYKKEILSNIINAKKGFAKQSESQEQRTKSKVRLLDRFKQMLIKKQSDVSEPEQPSVNEESDSLTTDTDTGETEAEVKSDASENEAREAQDKKADESDTTMYESSHEEQADAEHDEENFTEEKTEESLEEQANKTEVKLEQEQGVLLERIPFETLIDIPDFQIPKVQSRHLFLKKTDDLVENKRLSYLFERETQLNTYKEKRLAEIYHDLVEKFHEYLLANEEDIDRQLKVYEEKRSEFVDHFLHDFKDTADENLKRKRKTIEQQQKAERDDFLQQQKQALDRFDEKQKDEQDEILKAYRDAKQKELLKEKERAHQKFDEEKAELKAEIEEKVREDIYNHLLFEKQEQVKALNDEVFKYDEQTYKTLEEKSQAWKADFENQKQQEKAVQEASMSQAQYEAEKEKAQSEILSMNQKQREIDENNQRLKAQELEQKQAELAYKQEEQRLKAIEVDAKHKEAEAKKKEAERMIPMNLRKIAGIVAIAVLFLFILIMFAFQLFFNDGQSYAELVDEGEYVEAYERYPNRLSELLQTANENDDIETINYLSEQSPENRTAQLYQAIHQNDSSAITEAYESIETPQNLNDDILMRVADAYIQQESISHAQAVSTQMSDSRYSDRISEVESYMSLKEELEATIEDSDDDDEVEQAEATLEQIEQIFESQEEAE